MDDSALRVFCTVVERGSYSAAARSLDLDPSAVSRRMRGLEGQLGVGLFRRTTRSLVPTEAARAFYESVRPALRDLDEAIADLRAGSGALEGLIRVAAPGELGRTRVGPIVHTFLHAHPGVTIELLLADRRVDLVRERVDLAVRVGAPDGQTTVVRRLGRSPQVLVATPGYLARYPGLPEVFAGHRIINRLVGDRVIDLRQGVPADQRAHVRVVFTTDDMAAAADAALAGLGITVLPRWLADPHLAAGRLVALDVPLMRSGPPIYAALPLGRRTPTRVRALLEALVTAFAQPVSEPSPPA